MSEETGKYRPIVELLLARMESDPEEFANGHPRRAAWARAVETIEQWGTKAEKDAVRKARSDHYMGIAHKDMMKVLLGNEEPAERRRLTTADIERTTQQLLNRKFEEQYEIMVAKRLADTL